MLHEPSVSFQMFDPTPTFEYCKSWGVGAPQQLALGSAIRVRVGLGPPAYTCKYVYMHEMLQAQLLKPAMCIEGWPGRIKMRDLRRGLWKQLVPMACF